MWPNAVVSLGFREPLCSGCRPIVITHFNATVSTFRDCFRRVSRVGLPDSPAIVQNTLSSVKLCLSLNEVSCFRVSCSETLLVRKVFVGY